MKRLFISFFLLILTLLVGSATTLYLWLPREEVSTLKVGYVKHEIHDEGVVFKISKNRPAYWKKLDQISLGARGAILLSEDWAFFEHDGLDLYQIEEAIKANLVEGKKLRGASTISQQVVKNLFLTSERSLERKLKEAILTLFIEDQISKDKIFEIYLNIAQFAKDIYGVPKASTFYFKKNAKNLSPKEGAFLAMLLPSPHRYGQSFRQKKLTKFAHETVNQILEKMKVAKFLTKEQLEFEKTIPLSFEKQVKAPEENHYWSFDQ